LVLSADKTGSRKSSRSAYASRRFSGLGFRWDEKANESSGVLNPALLILK
jgi:hypothetical protein